MASKETKIVNKLTCPFCSNNEDFFEVAEDAIITTYYNQNKDGSFTANDQSSEILGGIRLFCASCGESLDEYHERFREMIF